MLYNSFKRLGFPEFWSDVFSFDNIFMRSLTEKLPYFILGGIENAPKQYAHEDTRFSGGFLTYREYFLAYLEWRELSKAHMEFLFEIINLVKYNRAIYTTLKIMRNSNDSLTYIMYEDILQESSNDSSFIQELNSICRKLPHAQDESPLINYQGNEYYGLNGWNYSDDEFRSMSRNIRNHMIANLLFLEESGQVTSAEIEAINLKIQDIFPYWHIDELFPIMAFNFPKGFK
jgi:hypothetical protein